MDREKEGRLPNSFVICSPQSIVGQFEDKARGSGLQELKQ